MMRYARFVLLGVVCLVPFSASAQTIAGTVTDPSGAVVPGVTVEASSPALIEKTRSVTTNEAGRYSIIDLRPGVYSVTFTLEGFNTIKRDGLELISDFNLPLNAQLKIGVQTETVTISTAAPVVDVQGNATPTVYTREMLDALPTGRTPAALMQTIPGVTPGFFGSQFRGTQDSLTLVDGMRSTFIIGAGPSLTTAASSSNMYQEYSFSTAIDSAEIGQPGMRINLVPRDGGNRFSGSTFVNYTRGQWSSSNLNAQLIALRVTAPAKTLKLWDFNPTFGGPLIKDKLWFQTTFRYDESATTVVNTFFDDNPDPFVFKESSRPGVNSTQNYSFVQRLTWQATPKDRVAGFYDWSDNKTPFFYSPLLATGTPPEGTLALTNPNNYQVGGRWSRTHTSRLLLEGSLLRNTRSVLNDYRGKSEAWSARYLDGPGLPKTRPEEYAVLNVDSNRQIGVATVSDSNFSEAVEARGSGTYVTGSHQLKAGVSFFTGSYNRSTSVVGNAVLRFVGGLDTPGTIAGTPSQVVLTRPGKERDDIDGDWAFFVQDRWTIRQLTVNAGLRMDWLMTSIPDHVVPASPWLGEQRFSARDVLNWKDLSPRLGAAYDLFGNGKTALKVAVARFVAGETTSLTTASNPSQLISLTDTRSWTDNGDKTIFNPDGSVQFEELGPPGNVNFGTPVVTTTIDDAVKRGWFSRGYSWETDASVQHELLPRLGVGVLFYRRVQGNQRATDNRAISPASYDGPFCVTMPASTSDARLPGGGNQTYCGLFDIKPDQRLLAPNNFNTFATNLGTKKGIQNIVTGYEISVNARLPRGAFLSGGINLQNVYANTCDFIDNPEVRFCETSSSYRPDFKLNGAYVLPFAVQVSATYQGLAGPQVAASWSAPGALVAAPDALGRPLAAGGTKTIALIEPGTQFYAMRHLFDLRFSKAINVQTRRIQLMADVYNAFNNNSITSINTAYGSTGAGQWLNPTGIVSPRQFRISTQIDF